MKILLMTNLYPGYEGQPRSEVTYSIHYYAKEWKKQGHDIEVIKIWKYYPGILNIMEKARKKKKYAFTEKLKIEGINLLRCPIRKLPKFDFSNDEIKKCTDIILSYIKEKEFKPDVILCHMINPQLYIAHEIKKKIDIPIILGIHNSDVVMLRNKRNVRKLNACENSIDAFGFRSPMLLQKVKENFGHVFNKKDNFLILSGISKDKIINDKLILQKSNITSKTIITACSLIPLKKIDVLIEAISQINTELDIKLKIIGEGPEKRNLIDKSKQLQVENKVQFLGSKSRDEVLDIMKESDVFAMVSSPETFGLVYVEAMAKGCITIGSKGEGIDGVIINNINGYLCKPDDVNDLKQTLTKVLNLTAEEKRKVLQETKKTISKLTQEELAAEYINNVTRLLRT